MRVKKKWIEGRKPFMERMTCQHWWELKYPPDSLISFVGMPCYVVCEKCGHRGHLFTKTLDPYQVQIVQERIETQNLLNFANSVEEENE